MSHQLDGFHILLFVLFLFSNVFFSILQSSSQTDNTDQQQQQQHILCRERDAREHLHVLEALYLYFQEKKEENDVTEIEIRSR